MPRNPGSDIDTASRRVRDRDGRWYPLDELLVAGESLYYARPVDDSEHFSYYWKWLLPIPGWVVSRARFHDHIVQPFDWYIETDFIDVEGPLWHVRDGYLDVELWEGRRYHVDDAHELANGLACGEITTAETAAALDALGRLCAALQRGGYSGRELLAEFAPGLPR